MVQGCQLECNVYRAHVHTIWIRRPGCFPIRVWMARTKCVYIWFNYDGDRLSIWNCTQSGDPFVNATSVLRGLVFISWKTDSFERECKPISRSRPGSVTKRWKRNRLKISIRCEFLRSRIGERNLDIKPIFRPDKSSSDAKSLERFERNFRQNFAWEHRPWCGLSQNWIYSVQFKCKWSIYNSKFY